MEEKKDRYEKIRKVGEGGRVLQLTPTYKLAEEILDDIIKARPDVEIDQLRDALSVVRDAFGDRLHKLYPRGVVKDHPSLLSRH